jgi:hypothetical protein
MNYGMKIILCMILALSFHYTGKTDNENVMRTMAEKHCSAQKSREAKQMPSFAERAYGELTRRGMSAVQSAGIVANLMVESGGDAGIHNRQGSGAYGLQQWTGARKKMLKEQYGDAPALEDQIQYLFDEYSGVYPGLGWTHRVKGRFVQKSGYYQFSKNEFDQAESPELAAVAWNQGYGRPGKSELANEKRAKLAREIYDSFSTDVFAA